jgi:hypothetical protein
MYTIKLPKILFLALSIASFYKKDYFNTNDLAILANKYKKDLVRQRVDKKDYKYLDDTNFGGLRGNFSTLVTWKGFVKRGSSVVNYYSIGKDGRLVSAICKGEIILDPKTLNAHTNNEKLYNLLETEAQLLNVREGQAHIKVMLQKNPQIPLVRDTANFSKVSVVSSPNGQYFIRGLLNNYVKEDVIEYSILNFWEGKKLKKKNLHILLVIPNKNNPWGEVVALKNEDLFIEKPLLVQINLTNRTCFDKNGKTYKLYSLQEALDQFSTGDENISTRLGYKWSELKERDAMPEVKLKNKKEDEFSVFVNKFLDWKKTFRIDGKDVSDIKVSSSGGPDVTLVFSGGTTQQVELEHDWKNYLDHKHHLDNAWLNVWIFAEEIFDLPKILKIFGEAKKQNNGRVPDVFLCIDGEGEKHVYKVDWDSKTAAELDLGF